MKKIKIILDDDQYVLDDCEIKALEALSVFAENTFIGYGEDLADVEQSVKSAFCWLVPEYIKLVIGSAKARRDWLEEFKEIKD